MNKLSRFTVEDFQSIKGNYSIDFSGITILCGPNSAGKSSLVDALAQSRQSLEEAVSDSRSHFPFHYFEHLGGGAFEMEMELRQISVSEFDFQSYISRLAASSLDPIALEILEEWEGQTISVIQKRPGIDIRINGSSVLSLVAGNELETVKHGLSRSRSDWSGSWWEVSSDLIPSGSAIQPKTKKVEPIDDNPRFAGYVEEEEYDQIYGGQVIFVEISHDLKALIDEHTYWTQTIDACARDDQLSLIGPVSDTGALSIAADNRDFYRLVVDVIKGALALFLDCEWPTVCPDDRRLLDTRDTYYSEAETASTHDPVNDLLLGYCQAYDPEFIKIPRGGGRVDPEFSNSFANRALALLDGTSTPYRAVTEIISSTSEFKGNTKAIDGWYLRDCDKRYRLWIQTEEQDDHVIVRGFEDVGSGLSYIFPVLAALDIAELALIQQPELHLHPAAQCELGDIFIAALEKGTSSVIETHSEHLILRILRRIRELKSADASTSDSKLSADKVSVLYFEPHIEGTRVHSIRVSEDGDFLDPWPKGFFSERERELFPEGF